MIDPIKVFITFRLAPELVEKVRTADPRIEITYEPDLLGQLRYPNDQHGTPIERTPEQEQRWLHNLSQAEIIFGYLNPRYASRIKELAPNLRWIQSPSAGIGQGAKRTGLTETDITLTEFGIEPPSIAGVVDVEDEAHLEVLFQATMI